MHVRLKIPEAERLLRSRGLGKDGDARKYLAASILQRMEKYMPYRSGAFIKKTIIGATDTQIISPGPEAAYLYHGKVMVDAKTGKGPMNIPNVGLRFKEGAVLKETDRDLTYDQNKNPQAGPFWDRAMLANEKDQLLNDLQKYVDGREGE